MDIMYPGSVPMQKVDWAAKKDFEWVHNYKILQTAFTKLKIDRHIDVDRLIQGKYMDNLGTTHKPPTTQPCPPLISPPPPYHCPP